MGSVPVKGDARAADGGDMAPTTDLDAPAPRLAAPVDRPAPSDGPSLAEVVLGRVAAPAPARTRPVLTLVVPMFREVARIESTVCSLAGSPLADGSVTFLFVDDGSPDATADVAEAAIAACGLADAHVLRLPRNVGKGGAVRAGVLAADTEVVGFVDADLSLDPSVVHDALARLRRTGVDGVVGHRVVDRAEQPMLRLVASKLFRWFTAIVAPTGVHDTQCAMKLFRTGAARALFERLTTEGFAFDVEVLLRARTAGMVVDEVPVPWTHQDGSSVDPLVEAVRMGRAVLGLRAAVRRTPTPSIEPVPSVVAGTVPAVG